jgi:ketosteroid isomerase-like protein
MDKPKILDRMERAMSSQDPSQVAACFTEDYRCEIPLHPSRGFTGNEDVRQNWTALFAHVKDHRARVLRWARDADFIWSEWEMTGTTAAGDPHRAGGVALITVEGDRVAATRFYLDQVTDLPLAEERRVPLQTAANNSWTIRKALPEGNRSIGIMLSACTPRAGICRRKEYEENYYARQENLAR